MVTDEQQNSPLLIPQLCPPYQRRDSTGLNHATIDLCTTNSYRSSSLINYSSRSTCQTTSHPRVHRVQVLQNETHPLFERAGGERHHMCTLYRVRECV